MSYFALQFLPCGRGVAILTGCAIALWIFVAMLWHDKKDWLVRLLSWAPLAYIGKLSYGIYVYHLLAQHLTWNVLLYQINNWSHYPKMGLRLIVYGVLSVAIAAFSYHFYEKPFLQLKKQLR